MAWRKLQENLRNHLESEVKKLQESLCVDYEREFVCEVIEMWSEVLSFARANHLKWANVRMETAWEVYHEMKVLRFVWRLKVKWPLLFWNENVMF